MRALLRENPPLLLFLVAAAGFVLGRVRVRGISPGVAAVLAGLAFACEQSGERANEGYTAVLPVAMIAKILPAQVVALALG